MKNVVTMVYARLLALTTVCVATFLLMSQPAQASEPVINAITPVAGQTTPWHKPVIAAQISGDDVDASSISLKLDNQVVDFNYNQISGFLSYTPAEYLTTGNHSIDLSVSDIQGNPSSQSWTFTIDTNFAGALHSNDGLKIGGSAYVGGDTYSLLDTTISGNSIVDGNGYATGFIRWDTVNIPFLGMPQSGVPPREFPIVDFDYYKSLAQAQGNVFSGKLHITKKKPQTGVIFVDGDLKISGGDHNITAVVTGEVKIKGAADLAAHIDSLVIIAKDDVDISGHSTISGVVYSEGQELEVEGSPNLSGSLVSKGELKVSGNMTAQDTLAPGSPDLEEPVSPTNDTTVSFTGLAEVNSAIEIIEGVQIVATGTADAAGHFNIPTNLPEGTHDLFAVAIDSAGNISEPSPTRQVAVDVTPPSVAFTGPTSGQVVSGIVTVETTAADNFDVDRVEFFLDNQPLGVTATSPYRFEWDTITLLNQTYQLKAVAYDMAGNTSQDIISVDVANNIISPIGGSFTSADGLVTLDFPPGAVSETVKITYARLVDMPVAGFSGTGPFFNLSAETLGGQAVSLFAVPFTLTVNSTPNLQNLSIYSYNLGQNRWDIISSLGSPGWPLLAQIDYFAQFALLADTEAPATSATLSASPTASGWHASSTNVSLNATDTGSGLSNVYYQWDATQSAWQTYTGSIVAPEGEHALFFYSEDMAGNQKAVQDVSVKVDTTAPTVDLITPTAGERLRGPVEITANAQDAVSGIDQIMLYLNDTTVAQDNIAPFSFTLSTTTYPDGPYTLLTKTVDVAGHETTTAVDVEIDNTAPVVVSNFPTDGDTGVSPNTLISVVFSEDVDPLAVNTASFYLSEPGGATVPALVAHDIATRTATLTPLVTLSEGTTYTANLTGAITDLTGNSLGDTAFNFSVPDLTPPSASISMPTSGKLSGTTSTIMGVASDNISVAAVDLTITRSSDGAYWTGVAWDTTQTQLSTVLGSGTATRTYSYSWALPQDDGLDTYTIAAKATDTAGLVNVAGASVSVGVDNISPVVTSTVPDDNNTSASPETVVTARFSEPVAATTVDTLSFYISDSQGIVVPASVSLDQAGLLATITPSTTRVQNETYTGYLSGAITDLKGNYLVPNSFSFSVPDLTPPSTFISQPTSGTLTGTTQLITGLAIDNLGVASVNIDIRRDSDGYYWRGATWVSVPVDLPESLEIGATSRAFNDVWELPQDDQIDSYTITAKAVDVSGLVDQIGDSVSVEVDNMAPVDSSFKINNGATQTVSLNVSLESSATGVAYMRFAESTQSLASQIYVPYQTSYDFEFKDQKRNKIVYGQYKDAGGNESDFTSAEVRYDKQLGSEDYFSEWEMLFGSQALVVNLASGNLNITYRDMAVEAPGISAGIDRSYNSLASTFGSFSPGWRLGYEAEITETTGGAQYVDSDGTKHIFDFSAGKYVAPVGVDLTLSKNTAFTLSDRGNNFHFKEGGAPGSVKLEMTERGNVNVTQFQYNAQGFIGDVIYSTGNKSTFTYTGSHLTSIKDPLNRTISYAYGSQDNLSSFTSTSGRQVSYGYDNGLLTSINDVNGSTKISYDSKDRVKNISEARSTTGSPVIYSFNYKKGKTKVTDPAGHVRTYYRNASGNTTKVDDGDDGASRIMEWVGNRLMSTSTSETGVFLKRDQLGNVVEMASSIGNETTAHVYRTYNARTIASETDANGNTINFSRDTTDDSPPSFETMTDSRGSSASIEYNANGNVSRIVDFHSPDEVLGVDYGRVEYNYDGKNYLQNISYPSGARISFGYDDLDDSWFVDGPNAVRTWFYLDDAAHQAHGDSRIMKVKNSLSEETTYAYDAGGNLTGVKDGRGNTSTYSYNAAGLFASATNPLSQVVNYSYDKDGQLIRIQSPARQADYNYDDTDRLTNVGYSGLGKNTSYTLAYWPNTNNLKTATGPNGDFSFDYNKAEWLTGTTDPFGFAQRYQHKPGGQIAAIGLGNETTTSYEYADNLMTSISGSVALAGFNYDARRNLTSINRANGQNSVYVNDKANRLTSLKDGPLEITYSYDFANNITTETKGAEITGYQYDDLDRMSGRTSQSGIIFSYAYDAASHMTMKETTDFTYNAANQLVNDGFNSYNYDSNGNMTSDGVNSFSWNAGNQLNSVVSSDGPATYTYDFAGRRSTKTLADGQIIRFHWAGWKLMAESDAAGIIATYTYTDQGRLFSTTRYNNVYYYHLSARGDVLALSDMDGNIVARYSYDPWGTMLSATGPLASQPFRYGSYYYDSESQMYYLGARYYRPDISRFISPDPASASPSKPSSFNAYIYANNNPQKYIDSAGTNPVSWFGGWARTLPVQPPAQIINGGSRVPLPADA